jgi:metallophosphoesterase (TIGR00282 family)
MGVDLITSGNHIWGKAEIKEYLQTSKRVLRPHNMPQQSPGSGIGYVTLSSGKKLAVLNLIGRVFMANYDCPFRIATTALEEIRKQTKLIFVDFHAETTSEKRALGWYLDGSISALVGTHTHIQTADEEILPGGTGYLTDVGMTGPHDSVIGVEKAEIIQKFVTQMPIRFSPATSGVQINAVVLEINEETGQCRNIQRIRIKESLENVH